MSVVERMDRAARRIPRSVYFRMTAMLKPRAARFGQIRYRGHQFLVLLNEDVGWRLKVSREFESYELGALSSLVRESDVCVDVGANVGLYAVILGAKARKGAVFAFDPNPTCVHITSLNVWLNGLSNVSVVQSAVADVVGSMTLSLSSDSAYSSLRDTGRKPALRTLEVATTTIDREFFERERRVDVLKVDVEGAELSVLRGASRLLSSAAMRPRAVLVELSKHNQAAFEHAPADVVAHMEGLGYEPWSITKHGVVRGWPRSEAVEDVLFQPRG